MDNPLYYKIMYGEGKINYKGLIYIPFESVVNMFDKTKQNNIKLYVKKILITENSQEICPIWLSFLVGIVETDDIPLNISRETLQDNDNIKMIRKMFIKKSIEMINEIKNTNFELYKIFFYKYGRFLKLGARDELDENINIKIKKFEVFILKLFFLQYFFKFR